MTQDMTKPYTGGPEYPTQTYDRDAAMNGIGVTVTDDTGMTLRDYFAANAPQVPAWYTPNDLVEYTEGKIGSARKIAEIKWNIDRITSWRFAYADSMLEARDQ